MTKFNLVFEDKYIPDDEVSFIGIGTGCHAIYEDDPKYESNDQQIYEIDEHDIGTCYPKATLVKELKKNTKYITG